VSVHLSNVVSYMLRIEQSVRGLLGGPWDGLRFSEKWRRQLEASCSLGDMKRPLIEVS
jgi:hypothetical protein